LAACENDYPTLSEKAIKILLPFMTTDLCETGFSVVVVMKPKYQSWLMIKKEIRDAI
jgi:hypothetical protein